MSENYSGYQQFLTFDDAREKGIFSQREKGPFAAPEHGAFSAAKTV